MASTIAKKSQVQTDILNELFNSAKDYKYSGDFTKSYNLYKEIVEKVKSELKERPQDKI
tara:strand:- start:246 stop:422 length:177 start_codon:yes stop_codon:yes gene_type:complete